MRLLYNVNNEMESRVLLRNTRGGHLLYTRWVIEPVVDWSRWSREPIIIGLLSIACGRADLIFYIKFLHIGYE